MDKKLKRGLGKGLGALLSGGSVLVGGRTIVNLELSKIVPNPRQPRKHFDSAQLQDLTDSIKAQGIAQPILVRQKGDKYELIAGERRWRASAKAGLTLIPAIVKDLTDEQSLEIAIVENLQREDLNSIEEAEAYNLLASEFKIGQADIARRVGKERSTVANTMRLLSLPKEIQASIRSGEISAGHARPLLGLNDTNKQIQTWKQILKHSLTVRDIEKLIYEQTPSSALKSKKKQKTNPELSNVCETLTGYLGTKVKVKGTPAKGRIEIDYFSQEDLERIIEAITGDSSK